MGNMPVVNNLHILSSYSKEAKRKKKSMISGTWPTRKDRKRFTTQVEGLVLETNKNILV